MLEPKIFYRKLDSLLNKIGREKTGKDFLFTIANEFEKTFGDDLRICNGRIYELYEDEYVLISQGDETPSAAYAGALRVDSKPVEALSKYKSYIYNDPAFTIDKTINGQKEYRIPAAFNVHSPEYTWIFVFELKSGWIREEIEFCMNAVRTSINYRLYSDSVKNDMQQAVQIQQSLLPQSAPQIPGYQIAARSIPAELVGGDLFDYFYFNDLSFGVCLGDASGHGLPAALLVRDVVTGMRMGIEQEFPGMQYIKKISRTFARLLYSFRMVRMLKKLNHVIYRSVYSSRFVSLFTAELDAGGNVNYINAGHPAPILVSEKSIKDLDSTGHIFGALPEISLKSNSASMKKGDVLVIFSDGIFERQNLIGEEFGIERLKQLIIGSKDKSAQEILNDIFSMVLSFGKNDKWEDDATVMVIKRTRG